MEEEDDLLGFHNGIAVFAGNVKEPTSESTQANSELDTALSRNEENNKHDGKRDNIVVIKNVNGKSIKLNCKKAPILMKDLKVLNGTTLIARGSLSTLATTSIKTTLCRPENLKSTSATGSTRILPNVSVATQSICTTTQSQPNITLPLLSKTASSVESPVFKQRSLPVYKESSIKKPFSKNEKQKKLIINSLLATNFVKGKSEPNSKRIPKPVEKKLYATKSVQAVTSKTDRATQTEPRSDSFDELLNYTLGDNMDSEFAENGLLPPYEEVNLDSQMFATNVSTLTVQQQFFNDIKNCVCYDSDGNMPIHDAVLDDNLNKIKRQCMILKIRNIPIDIENYNGYTPLQIAVLQGCKETTVSLLLRNNSDISVIDGEGNNLLHLAVVHSNSVIVKLLLEHKNKHEFNIDAKNYDGFTPLLLCALKNKLDAAVEILAQKANPNVRDDKSGRTALFHAVENNFCDMVQLLLEHNADLMIRNYFGTCPFDLCIDLDCLNPKIKLALNRKRNCKRSNPFSRPNGSWKKMAVRNPAVPVSSVLHTTDNRKINFVSVLKPISSIRITNHQ